MQREVSCMRRPLRLAGAPEGFPQTGSASFCINLFHKLCILFCAPSQRCFSLCLSDAALLLPHVAIPPSVLSPQTLSLASCHRHARGSPSAAARSRNQAQQCPGTCRLPRQPGLVWQQPPMVAQSIPVCTSQPEAEAGQPSGREGERGGAGSCGVL